MSIPQAELDIVLPVAIDWALTHGLTIRPPVKDHAIITHAPFALYPSPFPKEQFEKAKELQVPWNVLIHKMSQDDDLIKETMETLSKLDDFMDKLYGIYKTVMAEGLAQKASLGIHRCDYLLHSDNGSAKDSRIQQVEFNTISASFSSLSGKTTQLHNYLLKAVDNYGQGKFDKSQLPSNKSLDSFADGLASAWKLYGNPEARVMMIIQPTERNVFDQRTIEFALMENHGVHLIRRSLAEIEDRAILDPETKKLYIDGYEIAVSYYRAAYGPEDFHSSKEWDARLKVERSLSIKSPTIAYQLIGSKKVQQVLAEPGRLERYVDAETADRLRSSFAGLYPLDQSEEGKAAYESALVNPDNFVMKPQREGGGHNIYGNDILDELKKLSPEGRNAFILMDLIRSPAVENLMVREGQIITGEVVSELGIYGIYLNDGKEDVVNYTGGHLLRTKATTTKEGGVAAGFAVIDSPLLL
ncbi:glutathione synthase [Backusella circina FSU 941]|nr:glutathione synthase [Backusella circina FSU 941]